MRERRVALIGNPNAGKSSLFNQLTGLRQHVGNYPGITVDKHFGTYTSPTGDTNKIIDLPGTYSLFPKSDDEAVVHQILTNPDHPDFPDLVVAVVDATNLERNLLLFTQVLDLKIPLVLALNMSDLLEKEGLILKEGKLTELLGSPPTISMDARKGKGIDELKALIEDELPTASPHFMEDSIIIRSTAIEQITEAEQVQDTNQRYQKIKGLLKFCLKKVPAPNSVRVLTSKIDKVFTHPVAGYGIFLLVLFLIFQAIFVFATVPMDLIDLVFAKGSHWIQQTLPPGIFTRLLAEGIIPGIGGIVIFIPQIALLFAFIAMLEETGYMSRVVFIMDRLMRPFGLNGKSVVPLISGVACAIPAIMATRSIDQWKDRLVTIMVVPLVSCSARLPVYALLIALVVPNTLIFGFISLQGLALMVMYLIGFIAAIFAAILFKLIINAKQQSFLIMEMPSYKLPRWQNVGLILVEKTKVFVWEAGRIIMAVSVILWVLASFGPPGRMDQAVNEASVVSVDPDQIEAVRLENSWIGIVGKQMEPIIKPLGYDWQIGIALITSLAAREVFVSSMATIYSVGEDFEEDNSLVERLRNEVNPETGEKVYNLASGFSLMIFYAFAMQCVSTLAVVKRETKSWKWPLFQFIFMTAFAYIGALITYNLLK